jgi:hypothetical protein
MAYSCPQGFDVARLRRAIRDTYERVARDPHGDFHFHRGAEYAARVLGYDTAALASLPSIATDAFAGVGNPHHAGPIRAGEVVLDHGCGAGTDLLLAALRVGPRGGPSASTSRRACSSARAQRRSRRGSNSASSCAKGRTRRCP